MNKELAAEILIKYYVALAEHVNRLVEESYLETCRSIGKTEQFMKFNGEREAAIRECMRMPYTELKERLLRHERQIGKACVTFSVRLELMQRISERHKRFHTRRDRYSAGSKRGRRR